MNGCLKGVLRAVKAGCQRGRVKRMVISTKMLEEGRQHATDRLVDEAEAKGANAVIAFRFDTSELGSTWTEICAYGTAVRVRKA